MAGHNEKFMTNYEEQLTNNLDKKNPKSSKTTSCPLSQGCLQVPSIFSRGPVLVNTKPETGCTGCTLSARRP